MNEDEGQFLRVQVRTVIAALKEMDDRIRALEKGDRAIRSPKEEFIKAVYVSLDLAEEDIDLLLDTLDDYARVEWND